MNRQERDETVGAEPFWNLTNGVRPFEPLPGLFASICESSHHIYDAYYGPLECARCGHRTPKPRRLRWRPQWS